MARRVVAPYGVRVKTKEADEKWCRLDELRFCQYSIWQNVPKAYVGTSRGEVRSKCKALIKKKFVCKFLHQTRKTIGFLLSFIMS